MDNYYIKREDQPVDENGVKNFDTIGSIDFEAYQSDLQKLRSGKRVEILEYVFNNPNAQPQTIIVEPSPIIVTDGIFVLWSEPIRELLDLKLYIETPN